MSAQHITDPVEGGLRFAVLTALCVAIPSACIGIWRIGDALYAIANALHAVPR